MREMGTLRLCIQHELCHEIVAQHIDGGSGAHVQVIASAVLERLDLVELGSAHMQVLVPHTHVGTLGDAGGPAIRRPLAHGKPRNVATDDHDALVLDHLEHGRQGRFDFLRLLRNRLLQSLRVVDADRGE